MNERILIIEDEKDLVKGLRMNLQDAGYEVDWAFTGSEGYRKALEADPHLIILDIMLPEMDGLEICRNLRQKNINIPIIMLTAKGEEIDKIVGLEIGADDYMPKPFSIRELLARVKAHLRREKMRYPSLPNSYVVADAEIDFVEFKIRKKGKEFDLTSTEMELIKYLISRRHQVVTREELLENIWGFQSFPTTRTVDNHILRLRKKIETDPAKPRYILTVYGEGYRFTG